METLREFIAARPGIAMVLMNFRSAPDSALREPFHGTRFTLLGGYSRSESCQSRSFSFP
jgi:hypothetical protein